MNNVNQSKTTHREQHNLLCGLTLNPFWGFIVTTTTRFLQHVLLDKPPRTSFSPSLSLSVFSTRIKGNLYYWKQRVCIPIIFNVEAVNSQKEDSAGAARRGGVKPCDNSWKADREKLPRDSWERASVLRRQERAAEERARGESHNTGHEALSSGELSVQNKKNISTSKHAKRRRSSCCLPLRETSGGGAEWELVRPV